eukprot:Gb_39006 [translate_table: standard]
MGPLLNLVYFSCVSKAAMILAEHSDGDAELEELAAQCLERVPPLHSRFTHTTRRRMYSFLMDGPFIYCAIVDEALEKPQVFAFLEHVRDEFKKLLKNKSLEGFSSCCFDEEFGPVYRRLVAPLVGFPQMEKDRMAGEETTAQPVITRQNEVFSSPTASVPLYDNPPMGDFNNHKPLLGNTNNNNDKEKQKKNKRAKDQMTEVRDIIMENSDKAMDKGKKLEIMVDGNRPGGLSTMSLQKSASFRSKGQQLAQRMWWRNVRLVLLIDVVVCAILFGVWLGICHGFRCISE